MSVEEISVLHRQYVELSNRFRAVWAFHQFVGSLYKILLGGAEPSYPVDFQEIYADLKEISQHLNASDPQRVRGKLDRVHQQLERLTEILLAEDSKIEPSALRLFFNRVKNTDTKILTQLTKFFLFSYEGGDWDEDRIDKLDFLVTRIAAEDNTGGLESDPEATRELIKGLWTMTGAKEPAADLVARRCTAIRAVRSAVDEVENLEDLNRRQLVPAYRELKHSLAALFFHPKVLTEIVDTNLKLGERIQRLYAQEERRLFADYQRLSDLERERPLDAELDEELTDFRQEIERFEERLGRQDLSLGELTRLRERMRSLLPRLAPAAEERRDGDERPAHLPAPGSPEEDQSRAQRERLTQALMGSARDEIPRAVTLKPEIFPFRLEPREVVAFRRTVVGGGDGEEVEEFIFQAAALRTRVNEEAEEIRSILDDTAVTGNAPVFVQSRRTVRMADLYLRRFDHYMEQAILSDELEHARDLQVLKMRLMRDYSALWLLAHRPLINQGR